MFYEEKWIKDFVKWLLGYFEDVSDEEMNEFENMSLWLRYEES